MYLKVREAAARLGISLSYAYKLIDDGELPYSEVNVGVLGKIKMIPLAAIEAVEARRGSTGGEAA